MEPAERWNDSVCSRNPLVRLFLIPLCIGTSDSSSGDHPFDVSGHFVLLSFDVVRKSLFLFDSLQSPGMKELFEQKKREIGISLCGSAVSITFPKCPQQGPDTNDCAVFTFANVCREIRRFDSSHVFPYEQSGLIAPANYNITRKFFATLWRMVLHRNGGPAMSPVSPAPTTKTPPVTLPVTSPVTAKAPVTHAAPAATLPVKAPRNSEPPVTHAAPAAPAPLSLAPGTAKAPRNSAPPVTHASAAPAMSPAPGTAKAPRNSAKKLPPVTSTAPVTSTPPPCNSFSALLHRFEHSVIDSLSLFWARSGLGNIVKLRRSVDDASVREFLDSEVANSSCDVRDTCTQRAKNRLESAIVVCASCGTLCTDPTKRDVMSLNSRLLDVFAWPVSDLGTPPQGTVVIGKEIYDDRGWPLLLYHEGVDGNDVYVCSQCKPAIDDSRRPPLSMISGVCMGRRDGLPELSFAEVMAISRTRLFSTTVQLVPEHANRLHGTCISFPHAAPEKILSSLPSLPDSNINMIFVGTSDDWRKRRADILGKYYPLLYRNFTIRAGAILQWLKFLKLHHCFYGDISIDDTHAYDLENFFSTLANDSHVCSASEIAEIHAAATSDVAENRDGTGVERFEHVMITGRQEVPGVNVLDALADVLDAPVPDSVPITRDAVPVNEFTDAGELLSTAFPTLFLLGDAGFKATVTLKQARYLMLFHDGRFAKDPRFLFYVHNLIQRHSAIRQVKKMSLTGTEDEKNSLLVRFNSEEFKTSLAICTRKFDPRNPESAEAREQREALTTKLLAELEPHMRRGFSNVPNAPNIGRGGSVLSELYALVHYMGLPSLFVTVAPADFNDLSVMKLSMLGNGEPLQIVVPMWTKSVRMQRASANPVLCAEMYQRLLEVVIEELYGLCSASNRKKVVHSGKGIFGTMRAHQRHKQEVHCTGISLSSSIHLQIYLSEL